MNNMSAIISLLLVISALLLPNNLLLVVVIPLLIIISSYMEIIAPILTLGDKPVHVYDLIILTLAFKLFARFCLTGIQLNLQPLHRYIGLFVAVLFGATLLAYFRFGPVIFLSEIIAFFRFLMMIAIFFLFYYSVTSTEELQLTDRYFRIVGLAICLSVYLSFVLFQAGGIHFGEVLNARGVMRYFGPLGDQVGFIIALFCIREQLAGRTLHAVLHGAAIFATGTRGAILTLFIGLLLVYFSRNRREIIRPLWGKLAIITLIVVLLVAFGTMIVFRFTDVEQVSSGLTQRTLSMGLGLQVFLNNMLTGVGYSGFRFAAMGYDPEALFQAFALNFITNTSNQLIQVATDAGIPGLIAFLFLMKICYTTLNTATLQTSDVMADTFIAGRIWLVALLIGNQTAVWLIQGSIITYLFWVLLSMAAVATKIAGTDNVTGQVEA